MKKAIKNIILIILIITFLFSAYKVVRYLVEAKINKKLNNDLIDKAITIIENNEESEDGENNVPFTVDFEKLKQENNDIVGWIYSENTPINYTVVQSKDNNYYLRRLVTGEYNTAGSLFMDYRNNPNIEDSNTIIYGHNMKNATMFGTLQKYRNQEYYDNHKIMYYFTPEKNYIVRLFAGFTESVESSLYQLGNINQKNIEQLYKKSNFKSDVTVAEENKFLTLSTCAYEYDGARYIVVGIMQEIN